MEGPLTQRSASARQQSKSGKQADLHVVANDAATANDFTCAKPEQRSTSCVFVCSCVCSCVCVCVRLRVYMCLRVCVSACLCVSVSERVCESAMPRFSANHTLVRFSYQCAQVSWFLGVLTNIEPAKDFSSKQGACGSLLHGHVKELEVLCALHKPKQVCKGQDNKKKSVNV